MTKNEKNEIEQLPYKYRPLGAWSYFLYTILFSIPVIGIIFLIIFALDGGQVVRRSFARSYFCIYILVIVIVAIVIALGGLSAIVANFS